jgi:hypothetical protein
MDHLLIHLGRHLPGPVIGFVLGAGAAIAFDAGFPTDLILVAGLTIAGVWVQERITGEEL